MPEPLPSLTEVADYDAWRESNTTDDVAARVHEVAPELGVAAADGAAAFEADSTNLVWRLRGGRVLKVFPPCLEHQFQSERTGLAAIDRTIAIAMPRLLDVGCIDGWPWVLMTEVEGDARLDEVWPQASPRERAHLLFEIGRVQRAVHDGRHGDLSPLDEAWTTFIAARRSAAEARLANRGFPPVLLDAVAGFVDSHRPWLEASDRTVLLTGEYTPFNLLVSRCGDPSRWSLTGMIDLGDAFVGRADYDWLGPLTFLAAGDPRLAHAFLDGYGYPRSARDRILSLRLLALYLLHRYCHPRFQLAAPRWEAAPSLEALAIIVFPFVDSSGDRMGRAPPAR